MARVSICDWCKKISKHDFAKFVALAQEDMADENKADEFTTRYEVCNECFESLRAQLEGDDSLTTPRAATRTPSAKQVRGDSVPTGELLENEAAVIPSRVDQVDNDISGCKHKYEWTTDNPVDPHMACAGCGHRLDTESFD